ncbi:GTP-binding ADP-ribosylation factor-like protein yARL3 [Ceraceosorus bombacis]|uniref:GTP-binding ADP-ribosylation factor-like protein yARL3 n=1 Tax=Ceraceosorus bombacis TaxID=401625 RepID=A0A0P1BFN5_9BASI|nr:GTP-binding ADP-ribosylation factor-like protein yARL3 [Ceraceosorus bombacis]
MYSLLTGLYRDYSSVQTRCVLLLGPSQSGKTVLLTRIKAYSQAERAGSIKAEHSKRLEEEDVYERLKRNDELNSGVKVRGIAPTVGQNVHTFQPASSRIQLRFWDLGGSKALRAIWPRYFKETHVIVWNVDIAYWIDSSDAGEVFGESQSRLEEAEPKPILRDASLRSVPLVLYITDLGLFRRLSLAVLEALQDSSSSTSNTPLKQQAALCRVERLAEDALGRCKDDLVSCIVALGKEIKVLCGWKEG